MGRYRQGDGGLVSFATTYAVKVLVGAQEDCPAADRRGRVERLGQVVGSQQFKLLTRLHNERVSFKITQLNASVGL